MTIILCLSIWNREMAAFQSSPVQNPLNRWFYNPVQSKSIWTGLDFKSGGLIQSISYSGCRAPSKQCATLRHKTIQQDVLLDQALAADCWNFGFLAPARPSPSVGQSAASGNFVSLKSASRCLLFKAQQQGRGSKIHINVKSSPSVFGIPYTLTVRFSYIMSRPDIDRSYLILDSEPVIGK